MGTRFRYVADDALRAENPDWYPECHVCDAVGTVYPMRATVRLGDGQTEDISAVCESCLNTGINIEYEFNFKENVLKYFKRDSSNEDPKTLMLQALERLAHNPRPAKCVQGFDWPLCCNDFCEFLGSPANAEAYEAFRIDARFWVGGPAGKHLSRNFLVEGPPELWTEVSFFRCSHCGKKHYIDQYT
ncbi:MAG: CbrC family protein [Planctomycetes bacterium]|nr:CbrC family protein [Planctomycetota bacterium]